LKGLGPQSSDDLSFLTSAHAMKYVAELHQNINEKEDPENKHMKYIGGALFNDTC